MKILNLYAGIGGNRKLWNKENLGFDIEVTAVEIDENIAEIYQDFFPNDIMIVGDAHQYLLEHFKEYDFIWSSPPCPSHSRIRNEAGIGCGQNKPVYPDMKLWQEIILLQHMIKMKFYKGIYCIENVISYYKPILSPQKQANHYFWANFAISEYNKKSRNHHGNIESLTKSKGMEIKNYTIGDKRKLLRNCVKPQIGLHILNCAYNSNKLFED